MTEQEIQVQEVLKTLQPAMEADGGGVELISVEEGIARIKFNGACLLCPSIGLTMKFGIEKTIREKLPWIKRVVKINNE